MVCLSLLQGTTFGQTSPPWPVRLGWPHTAWLSVTELDKAVVLWSDWLVFCDYGLSVSALWCLLATPTVLPGFLLPWTWGISAGVLVRTQANMDIHTLLVSVWTGSTISERNLIILNKIEDYTGISQVAQWRRMCLQCRRCRFNPWVRKIPWRRKWEPTPVFLLGDTMDRGAWWATVHGVTKSRLTNDSESNTSPIITCFSNTLSITTYVRKHISYCALAIDTHTLGRRDFKISSI